MTKGKAVTLGVFSLWPFIYMIFFMVTMFTMMASSFANSAISDEPPIIMMVIFPLHFFTMLEIFILLGIYIFYLFKTEVVPQDKKALWAVVLFLGNMIAMPVFWYLYVWKNVNKIGMAEQSLPSDAPTSRD